MLMFSHNASFIYHKIHTWTLPLSKNITLRQLVCSIFPLCYIFRKHIAFMHARKIYANFPHQSTRHAFLLNFFNLVPHHHSAQCAPSPVMTFPTSLSSALLLLHIVYSFSLKCKLYTLLYKY